MTEAKAKARVLVDNGDFRINEIVEGEDAERGVAEGWADGDRAAVAYAEKLKRQAARAARGD